MNLLSETVECLKSNGKTTNEVFWVGSKSGRYAISWKQFADIANINYHEGFGGQEIASDLVIVGQNWWMERHEYDGSEWWEFKDTPIKMPNAIDFETVWNNDIWASIEEMNRPGGKYNESSGA